MIGCGEICASNGLDVALQRALHAYRQGLPGGTHLLLQALKLETSLSHLRCLHSILTATSMAPSSEGDIANHLTSLFASEESVLEASIVFCVLPEPIGRAYHGIISLYGGIRGGAYSFELYKRMLMEGIQPNEYTFPCVLKVCGKNTAPNEGHLVHNHILCLGFEMHSAVEDALIDMYVKCGLVEIALQMFRKASTHSLIAWSTLIGGCTQNGQGLIAIELFQETEQLHIKPDIVMLSCILNACSTLSLVEEGQLIYDKIIRSETVRDVVVENTLINMYAKHGRLDEACSIFNKLSNPSLISWGSLLDGYVENGQSACALAALEQMQSEGARLDKVVYLCAIRACASMQCRKLSRKIHNQVISNRFDTHLAIKNALICMYVMCGAVDDGYKIIYQSKVPDLELWATLFNAILQSGTDFSVTELLERMMKRDVTPDQACLLAILKSCGQTDALREGRVVHHMVVYNCFDSDPIIGDNLVSMYAHCYSLNDATNVFHKMPKRSILSWSAMITCYSQPDPTISFHCKEIFDEMQNDNVQPDQHLYACALKACANACSLDDGKWVHSHLISSGVEVDAVIGCILVDLYAKCGELEEACRVFEDLEERDLVSWGAMIAGCISQGNCALALCLYGEMRRKGIEPNAFVLSSVLKGCALLGARNQGLGLHDYILRCHLESDLFIESALINFYVKCEYVDEATYVRKASKNGSVVSWGALISGYAQGANAEGALECVEKMELEGSAPNEAVYERALSACGHAGHVDNAYLCFSSIMGNEVDTFNSKPYSDMADVYARAGYAKVASELLQSLPAPPPNTLGWTSLYCNSGLHAWPELTLKSNSSA